MRGLKCLNYRNGSEFIERTQGAAKLLRATVCVDDIVDDIGELLK
jgi:hypothetical protein